MEHPGDADHVVLAVQPAHEQPIAIERPRSGAAQQAREFLGLARRRVAEMLPNGLGGHERDEAGMIAPVRLPERHALGGDDGVHGGHGAAALLIRIAQRRLFLGKRMSPGLADKSAPISTGSPVDIGNIQLNVINLAQDSLRIVLRYFP